MNDGVGTRVLLDVLENAYTPKIVSASDHHKISNAKFDAVFDLLCLKIELDSVVLFYVGVRVADGATVVGGNEWDSLGAQLHALNLAQLVLGLILLDWVQSEFTLYVVQEAEVFTGALDGDNIFS